MMFGEAFVKGKGDELTYIRDLLIEDAMGRSVNIIIDNTNLSPKREAEYRKVVNEHNDKYKYSFVSNADQYEFQIKDFTDVPLQECLRRNLLRPNPVPAKVIYDMHNQFLAKPWKPMEQSESLPWALIVDIDGTVADISHRGPYEQKKVSQDAPIREIIDLVKTYQEKPRYMIYLSGREEYCRADTLAWLNKQGLRVDKLLLNVTGEKRSSTITKKEIFDREIKGKYYVEFVLEDRHKNVQAWREMGLRCLQVDDGNF